MNRMSVISDIIHHLQVAWCCARLSVQRQLEYPLFLVSFVLMIPIQYITGLLILKVLVDRFQSLGGWDFEQLTFFYGLGLLSHSLVIIFFIPTWQIDDAIIQGQFDRFLMRPLNVFFHYCFYQVNFIGVIDLIPALVIFFAGCSLAGVDLSLTFFMQLVLVVLGATLIRASIYTVLGTVAFWTKKSRPLVMMGLAIMDRATQFPINVYPYLLQFFLTFLVPIAFINFIPASEFLEKPSFVEFPLGVVVWTPLIGGFCFFIAHAFFRFALRCYESSGS